MFLGKGQQTNQDGALGLVTAVWDLVFMIALVKFIVLGDYSTRREEILIKYYFQRTLEG